MAWSCNTGERQGGAAAGNGSAAVATLLPPDFNGTIADKHARVDESTWHTASSYPSWEVDVDRDNNNSLSVVYKMSSRTISHMYKMYVCRQISVVWAPVVDASGRYSLCCSVYHIMSFKRTPMKTAYRRRYIAVFAIYAHRHTYVWHVLKCECCDLMATVTSAVTQNSATIELLHQRVFYPKWSDDEPFDTLGNAKLW